MEALKKISDWYIEEERRRYVVFPLVGKPSLCGLRKSDEDGHRGCRKQFVWARLPNLLGWESWEGV
jgi:hypothetical protein